MRWKGFLPENAIIMRRRSSQTENVRAEEPADVSNPIASSPTPATPALPTPAAPAPALARARLVFISDCPANAGAPGELLEKMIAAMMIARDQVLLTSIVPAGVFVDEASLREGRARLLGELEQIQPEAVVALGQAAARAWFVDPQSISSLRGKFREIGEGARTWKSIATFHPTDLLRAPDAKREAWADLKLVAKELALPISRS